MAVVISVHLRAAPRCIACGRRATKIRAQLACTLQMLAERQRCQLGIHLGVIVSLYVISSILADRACCLNANDREELSDKLHSFIHLNEIIKLK